MKHRFVRVGVFADRPLAGNPLALFPESDGLLDLAGDRRGRVIRVGEGVLEL